MGPLLVSADAPNFSLLEQSKSANSPIISAHKVALPGENTTAHRLFTLAFPNFRNKIFVRFNEIEELVAQSKVAAGVLIHENELITRRRD